MFGYLIGCLFVSAYLSKLSMIASLIYSGLPTVGIYFFGFFDKKRKEHLILYSKQNAQIESLAKVAEREKIARDMHDILGHSLTAISLKAQLASKLLTLSDNKKAKIEVEQIIRLAKDSLEDVRDAICIYKKRTLNEWLIELKQDLLSSNFEVKIKNTIKHLDEDKESTVVLLIIEAVTNILKHSSGNRVFLDLKQLESQVVISIEDNGDVKSFDEGNGLIGMRERVNELNGEFNIFYKNGFKIKVVI